ncbi:MAG TPA: type IV secretory system conjugative DNA transfer family protein [Metabacillus sp.]|nr:type IV secretory system conjugative DNA transfer family protein [Metabacillus sp.]
MKELDKRFWRKVFGTIILTLMLSYTFLGVLRTLLEFTDFEKNILDFKNTVLYFKKLDNDMKMVFAIFVSLITVFIGKKMGFYKRKYEDASDFGVHGTSRWGKFEELLKGEAIAKNNKYSSKKLFKSLSIEDGLIIAKKPNENKLLIIPKDTTVDNRNVLVIGSSGSGKGQSFVFPNLINNTEDTMIVTDPKGELYEATHQLKRDQGYEVYQIDFINFEANAYNPLDYVEDDQNAIAIAKTISKNSKKDDKEDYFFNTAKDLLAGLIIYCKEKNSKANIPVDVKREFYKISDDENYLRELCEEIGESHPAYNLLKDASVAEGKTRTSILSSFAQQTAIFSLRKIANMTKHSDFNFRDFQKKKSILYIKIRMDDNPFTPLTATFFDQLISVFYDIADENHSRLPIPSIFLLDEFANIGKIEKYGRVLATCRGLGMSMCTVIQDIAQLEGIYGKELARTIISNHDTVLYLRTKDIETAKYFSNLAGETTARMYTGSTSQQGGLFSKNYSHSSSKTEQFVKKPLITEGELINIRPDTCYVFVSGYYPLKLEKSFQYKIYGDFLFGKDRKPNYHSHRSMYLKFLGVEHIEQSMITPINNSTRSDENDDSGDSRLNTEYQSDNHKENEQISKKHKAAQVEVVPIKEEKKVDHLIEELASNYLREVMMKDNTAKQEVTAISHDNYLGQFNEMSDVQNDLEELTNILDNPTLTEDIKKAMEYIEEIEKYEKVKQYVDDEEKLEKLFEEAFELEREKLTEIL